MSKPGASKLARALAGTAEARDVPIIFSAPMVNALLDGRKTMTRRLAWRRVESKDYKPGCDLRRPYPRAKYWEAETSWQKVQPGDRLWVRENHAFTKEDWVMFAADSEMRDKKGKMHGCLYQGPWKPSIHMPRWASRLTLEVTAVKVQKLQDISIDDMKAEGLACSGRKKAEHLFAGAIRIGEEMIKDWEQLWTRLHGAESWNANPEVVAISFAVCTCNIDKMDKSA